MARRRVRAAGAAAGLLRSDPPRGRGSCTTAGTSRRGGLDTAMRADGQHECNPAPMRDHTNIRKRARGGLKPSSQGERVLRRMRARTPPSRDFSQSQSLRSPPDAETWESIDRVSVPAGRSVPIRRFPPHVEREISARRSRCQRQRRGVQHALSREAAVLVLAHVGDLAAHRDKGEDAKVHDQDRPEDGDVKHGNEGGNESKRARLCRAVPARRGNAGGRESGEAQTAWFLGRREGEDGPEFELW